MIFRKQSGHDLEGPDTRKDYFVIDEVTYQALPLSTQDAKIGHGVNATVFAAAEAENGEATYALKVCNFSDSDNRRFAINRKARFEREIEAMYVARNAHKTSSVVEILGDGRVLSSGQSYRCLLMERGDMTLREFFKSDVEITPAERLHLCLNIGRSILALHEIDVYHRDIKPENVLLVNGAWKIADLGLASFRDIDCDGTHERIGSIGWMCPEAINKAYATPGNADTRLDERSDVHQIGKLFWFVLQGDIPNGCVKSADFRQGSTDLFGRILKPLLWYSRKERPYLRDVLATMEPLTRLC